MTCASVHANLFFFIHVRLQYDSTATILHTSPSATTLKARHLSRHISVFFSTTRPGINPVSFTKSRSPAYNARFGHQHRRRLGSNQPRRDPSEFSQRQASAKNFLEIFLSFDEQNSNSLTLYFAPVVARRIRSTSLSISSPYVVRRIRYNYRSAPVIYNNSLLSKTTPFPDR